MANSDFEGRRPYPGPIYEFQHAQLGPLTGRLITSPHFSGHSAVQFCSIPYAKIPKRFAPCTPLDTIPDEFDARPPRVFTQPGHACPESRVSKSSRFSAYGGQVGDDIGLEFDEFACLTVSISIPHSHLTAVVEKKDPKPLPVLVYVHGGGIQEGVGHVDGLHSNAPLAAFSSELSLPVITVNIGYRINWLGSLVSQDMLDEYNADPSVSPHGPFNLSIQDQRAAFAWIHKFIGGFGGDVDNITAFGESAGSALLIYHICGSPEKLFTRVILQSGVVFGHMSFEQKEQEYQGLLKHFDIQESTASERLEKLRHVPAEDLAKYPGQHMLVFVDDPPGVSLAQPLFPRGRPTFMKQMSLINSCPWLEDIIIGDDFWEGWGFREFIQGAEPVAFVEAARSIFPEQQAARLLDTYHLPKTPELAAQVDGNLFWGNLTYLVGDLFLSEPIHKTATYLSRHGSGGPHGEKQRKIYRYSFGLSNPFPGSDHSFVTGHHFVEILFVFLTLLDRYPKHRDGWIAKQAKETAKRWIMFANGQAPWDEYVVAPGPGRTDDAKMAVCDDLRGWHVRTLGEDEVQSKSDPWGERRYEGWGAIERAYEALREPGTDVKAWAQHVHMARLMLLRSAITPISEKTLGSKE